MQQSVWILVSFLPPAQYEVRMKTIALTLVGGKKKSWHYNDRWLGDELGSHNHNSRAEAFDRQVLNTLFPCVPQISPTPSAAPPLVCCMHFQEHDESIVVAV